MDRLEDVGAGEGEDVVVALQVLRVVPEALPAVVGLGQAVGLHHRPHRAVDDDDPLREQRLERVDTVSPEPAIRLV